MQIALCTRMYRSRDDLKRPAQFRSLLDRLAAITQAVLKARRSHVILAQFLLYPKANNNKTQGVLSPCRHFPLLIQVGFQDILMTRDLIYLRCFKDEA